MSNYSMDTLVTFMSAYDPRWVDEASRHRALSEGAADFIEAYGLVYSAAKVEALINDYIEEVGD